MKFKRVLANKLILLSLLVYFLTGFGSAFGALWCLHAEDSCPKETASLSFCPLEAGIAESAAGGQTLRQEKGCGPCIDIPLISPFLKSRPPSPRSLGTPFVAIVPPVFSRTFPPADLQFQNPSEQFVSRESLSLIHLRTVVLLN